MINIGNDWDEFAAIEQAKPYYAELKAFLISEYRTKTIYPEMKNIFNAFHYTPLSKVKAVILGQDPYINPGEAHGMAFSVMEGAKIPPSLRNIFLELRDDLGYAIPNNGCLVNWANQGVLLLNTVLTVAASASKSHAGRGWEIFTAEVIKKINERENPVVFLLWGKSARDKAQFVTNPRHLVLTAAHPSPLAGGAFFGSRHFSKTNEFLRKNGIEEIDWRL